MLKKTLPFAALALLLTSCSAPVRPEAPKPECTYDSDCSDGKVCGPTGRCVAECSGDADCRKPESCQSGLCALPPGGCFLTSDCAAGQVCNAVGQCVAECAADTDCPAPETCQSGVCALPSGTCHSNGDCGAAQTCAPTDRCVAKCSTATECGAGKACIEGGCLSLAPDQCNLNSDCPSGQGCVNGRCATACADARDCPVGTQCQSGSCVLPSVECLQASDCAGGKACSPGGLCVTACTSVANCAASGEACSNGACVAVGTGTSTLSGAVALQGLTAAGGISVRLKGLDLASATTGADGSYKFEGLKPGVYQLSYTASSTVEASLSREVFAKAGATTTVPTVTFTPAGSLTGSAKYDGRTSHAGINVLVSGTAKGTLTDAQGNWRVDGLPAGSYDLVFSGGGYMSQTRNGLAVAFNATTTVPLVTLLEPPTATGSTFAFLTTPPSTHRVDQPYSYTAQAAGAGVTTVTYGLTSFPAGMTIDENSGTVSWAKPSIGTFLVAVSARGGGVTIYQVWTLSVTPAVERYDLYTTYGLGAGDAGVWASQSGRVLLLDAGMGPVREFNSGDLSVSGSSFSLQVANGGNVTKVSWPGGKVTSVEAPSGIVSASWEGGVVASIAPMQSLTVASKALRSGTTQAVAYENENVITAVSYPRGTITGVADPLKAITSLSFPTGVVSSITGETLTDATASWTGNLTGQCLSDAAGATRIAIASNTATTISVAASVDLSSYYPAGRRYFIVNCSNALMTATLEDSTAAFTSTATSRQLDLYSATLNLDDYDVTAAPTATTLQFTAPVTVYPTLLQATSSGGRYALAYNSGGWWHDVTISDSTAPFGAVVPSSTRVTLDDFGTPATIVSATATDLVYRAGLNTLLAHSRRVGRDWVLTNTSNNVLVTATVQTGGMAANAFAAKYLRIDRNGEMPYITSNGADTFVLQVGVSSMPVNDWVGSVVAPVSSYWMPGFTLTAAGGGLLPGSLANRALVLLEQGGPPFELLGDITLNTSTTIAVAGSYCGGCVGEMTLLRQRLLSGTWASGRSSTHVDFRLNIAGTPNFSPDALLNRTVVLDSKRDATGTVIGNGTDYLDVEVDSADFTAFQTLVASSTLWLSEPKTGSAVPMRIRLTPAAGGLTVDAWAGYTIVAPSGSVLGVIESNDATSFVVTVSNQAALSQLGAGARFGLAKLHPGGSNCSEGVWVKATVSLAGGTLIAGRYDGFRARNSGTTHIVTSNSTSDATVLVCPSRYDEFLGGLGQQGIFTRANRIDVTLNDSTASWTADEHAGRYVTAIGQGFTANLGAVVTTNTQTSVTVSDVSDGTWISNLDRFGPGNYVAFGDSLGLVDVTLTTDLTLTPNALAGRVIELHSQRTWADPQTFYVVSNDASTITGGRVEVSGYLHPMINGSIDSPRWVRTSQGVVLKVTDTSKSWSPNELVGRVGWTRSSTYSTHEFTVIANTQDTVTMASDDEGELMFMMAATSYGVTGYLPSIPMTVLPNGDALSATYYGSNRNNGLWRLTPGGYGAIVNALSTARPLDLVRKPVITGTFAFDGTESSGITTFADPAWSWTPGELAGGYLQVWRPGGDYRTYPILQNTQTAISVLGYVDYYYQQAGKPYAINRARVGVTGAALTPSELAGKILWINGDGYVVRDNTADELHLVFEAPSYSGASYVEPVDVGGTKGLLLDGLPRDSISALESDGAAGYWVATQSRLARFDGSTWSVVPELEGATLLNTGTVTSWAGNNGFIDQAASYTAGALIGKRLWLPTGVFTITGNTATSVSTNNLQFAAVAPGTTYKIFDDDGIGSAPPRDVSVVGTTLWVATTRGLFKRVGSTWTRYTVANTQSAPGAADGLASDSVASVLGLSDTEAIVTYGSALGASRLSGTSWTRYTVASTESAPGLYDGLPNNTVTLVHRDGSGALWFGGSGGVSVLSGATWTRQSPKAGINTTVRAMLELNGERYFGTDYGIIRYLP